MEQIDPLVENVILFLPTINIVKERCISFTEILNILNFVKINVRNFKKNEDNVVFRV